MKESQPRRAVIDTNVYISSFLRFNSISSRAVLKAEWDAEILVSDAVLAEYSLIFRNPKFDKYVRREDREQALRHIQALATVVEIPTPIAPAATPRTTSFSKRRCMGMPTRSLQVMRICWRWIRFAESGFLRRRRTLIGSSRALC